MQLNWQEMFSVDANILELVIRTSILYLGLLVAMRVVGRREVGMELPDLLMVVLISEGISHSMGKYGSITSGLVVAGTLLGWSYVLDWLVYRFPLARKLLRGAPLKIVEGGRMLRRNMRREFISVEELNSHLRSQGIESVEMVKVAYLEPDGELSVIKRDGGKGDGPKEPRKTAAAT